MDTTFVMGANSRVGQMLRRCWRGGPVRWQARSGAEVTWALADGAAALARAMRGCRDVLCLAGATPGAADFSLNVALAQAAVEAAAAAGCRRVLLASTMAVYGAGQGPQSEDDPCVPVGDYGASKLGMERDAQALGARLGVAVTALRMGNVLGGDMLFRNILGGREITLDRFADGSTPVRSYMDPESFAAMLADLLAQDTLPPVLNVACRPAVGMGALCDAAGVPWRARPAPEGALKRAEMNLDRLAALIPVPDCSAGQMAAAWRRVEQDT